MEAEEAIMASAVAALVVAALLLDAEICDGFSAVVDVVDEVASELGAMATVLLDIEVGNMLSAVVDVVGMALLVALVPFPGSGPCPRCT